MRSRSAQVKLPLCVILPTPEAQSVFHTEFLLLSKGGKGGKKVARFFFSFVLLEVGRGKLPALKYRDIGNH